MPGRTEVISDTSNDSFNYNNNINNNMDQENGSSGNGIYTIHAMGANNPDRYLSNESLETNSSSESNSALGNIQHRKDHEFIPTRMKQISASKPAADPKQFTRVPSNPLLVSAQKQLMMVEEVKKAKELALKPKVKGGDDEPDWQNNLSTWKTRRRKQSEEALQRVSEVRALEEGEFEPKKSSIGRKLSTLLYTAPEDDWSDLGIEKTPSHKSLDSDSDSDHKHNNYNSRSHSRTSLKSPILKSSIPELEDNETDDYDSDRNINNISKSSFGNHSINSSFNASVKFESKLPSSAPFKQQKAPVLQRQEKVDEQGDGQPKPAIVSEKIETPPSIPVSVLNRKFSEVAVLTTKPIVTYTYQDSSTSGPPVRRKSSELSNTMKSRLEAFISQQTSTETREKSVDLGPEPDEKFHEKLQTFRKISEGTKEEEALKKPKPPLSISSLIGPTISQSNLRTLPSMSDEGDNDDSVDKMLDDALEESYRSVLEESDHKDDSLGSQDSRKNVGDDFLAAPSTRKAPPAEKPPPPPSTEPPVTPVTKAEPSWNPNLRKNEPILDDEEIDKQELEIIASLENEEKEHKKYMETVQAMRALPPISSEEKPVRKSASISSEEFPANKLAPSISQPQLANPASNKNLAAAPKKRTSEGGNQKPYNNQHWLIQEAEQRRLADLQLSKTTKLSISPAASSPATSLKSQTSPVYENLNNNPQSVSTSTNFTNHQRPDAATSPVYPDSGWQSQAPTRANYYPQENLYANLGSVSSPQSSFETSPVQSQRDPVPNPGRLPGPQVPPRIQADRNPAANGSKAGGGSGERMLSVSGKKKCSHCKEELGRGAAMIMESLRLFYHLRCFQCCVCHLQLGNGTAGTDVRVRNNRLHCQNCYSNDEGLKFSKV